MSFPSRPLSVVHIASGDRWAGAEAQLFTLATHLAREQGLQVGVILLNEGELAERLRGAGIAVEVFDEATLGFLALLRRIGARLAARRPDIVHTHRQKENILGALASWRLGIPSVRTVHGAPEHAPRGLRHLHKHLIVAADRWLGRRAQRRVIAVSPDLHAKLATEFPGEQLVTVENGIDLPAARAARAHPAVLDEADSAARHVGIAGRLDPVKRVDLFLRMAAELRRRGHDDWRFHVFGDGKLRGTLEELAHELGVADRVHFHGHRQDIGACLAALDALLMCSDHEGLPMTPLESIAVGTPVVAHAVGGLIDILQGDCGGILVHDHVPEAYADAVERLLGSDPAPLLACGNARLEQRYSAGANAAAMATLYRRVLEREAA